MEGHLFGSFKDDCPDKVLVGPRFKGSRSDPGASPPFQCRHWTTPPKHRSVSLPGMGLYSFASMGKVKNGVCTCVCVGGGGRILSILHQDP